MRKCIEVLVLSILIMFISRTQTQGHWFHFHYTALPLKPQVNQRKKPHIFPQYPTDFGHIYVYGL